ncbi:hypothetical protein PQQ86_38480 [Paraburkholderia sediminicola]|uniref:hypothetical protein n=1 Tax=Paraburkholderia sediminicola TaxID=458836 RepID=UPI0038BBE838
MLAAERAQTQTQTTVRWRVSDVVALYALPFSYLLHRAQTVDREHFDSNPVQLSMPARSSRATAKCGCCARSVRTTLGRLPTS